MLHFTERVSHSSVDTYTLLANGRGLEPHRESLDLHNHFLILYGIDYAITITLDLVIGIGCLQPRYLPRFQIPKSVHVIAFVNSLRDGTTSSVPSYITAWEGRRISSSS